MSLHVMIPSMFSAGDHLDTLYRNHTSELDARDKEDSAATTPAHGTGLAAAIRALFQKVSESR